MNRPITTLFLIESLDGKITLGDNDSLDIDKDFPKIPGVAEGLYQYYDLEKKTDLVSLNSGRVMEKIGINTRTKEPEKEDFSFVIIDNKPHLSTKGLEYLSKWVKRLYVVTTNKKHPAFDLQTNFSNIEILYNDTIDLKDVLVQLKQKFGIKKITIQSGGTLNAQWVRRGLIDKISIVIAPVLIGGQDTQSLIGGESLHSVEELYKAKALKLLKVEKLKHSYLHVIYKVL